MAVVHTHGRHGPLQPPQKWHAIPFDLQSIHWGMSQVWIQPENKPLDIEEKSDMDFHIIVIKM